MNYRQSIGNFKKNAFRFYLTIKLVHSILILTFFVIKQQVQKLCKSLRKMLSVECVMNNIAGCLAASQVQLKCILRFIMLICYISRK